MYKYCTIEQEFQEAMRIAGQQFKKDQQQHWNPEETIVNIIWDR